jgi:alpha-tubulin suppressor-like RCC1 family protein
MKKTLLLLLIFSCLQINAQCWKTAATGYSHTVAVRTDGTLWTWGNNDQGQLGTTSPATQNVPTKMGTSNDWSKVAAGWGHTVALKTDGSLWAWGYGGLGQIGNGTYTTNFNPPQQIGIAKNWQTIVTGHGYTVALKADGTLWAWGNNFSGQLGNGTTFDKNIPTQVGTASDWQTVVAGMHHTVALKKDGTLWAWGKNTLGELGDGTTTNSRSPKQIGTETNWKTIAAGSDHTIAIKTDGTLWIWGDNTSGALGDGTTVTKNVPTQIGMSTDWKTLNGGVNYTMAIKTDGSLWGWGNNSDGKLGNGTIINSLIPVQIGTENNWQIIDGGAIHTIAIKSDESLWTWGKNSFGQLGDATTTDKNIPTLLNCLGSLIVKADQSNVTCSGDLTGSASITDVSGGTAPYTYLWSNGKTTSSIIGLAAGEYSCTITDATSLSITKSFTITQPMLLDFIVTATNTACNNNDGILTVTATGGTLPYQYAISPSSTYQVSNVFDGLAAGNYTVRVRDNNGCIQTNTIVITTGSIPPPTANAQTLNNNSTIANLKAVGSNLKWYDVPVGGTALNLSTVLQTGTYYVSQTINGCESVMRASVNVTITVPSGNEQLPTNGLVAHYPFNGNANDTSGNGSNGTVTAATLTSDRFGNSNTAYSFDGVSSYIDAVIPSIPKNNAARTISGWFKTNDTFSDPNKYDATVFNYGSLAKLQRLSLSIYSKGYLQMISGADFSSDDFYINNFDYANNDWYFFTLTYDGTKISIFVNGQLVDQKAVNLDTVGNIFRIGQRISGDNVKEGFKGTIDDIAIWNRVLTPEEIAALYTPVSTTNYTLIPDANFEKKLIDLGIDSGTVDGKVLTSNIVSVTNLDVSSSSISDLSGIEDFKNLDALYFSSNLLTSVDLSKNNKLFLFFGRDNKLTSIKLPETNQLYHIHLDRNNLAALDVSKCDSLRNLSAEDNQITNINLSRSKDLETLFLDRNKLTSLDISKNTVLKTVWCGENQLSSVVLPESDNLDVLYLNANNFTSLDVSRYTSLKEFVCSTNELTEIDISNNKALTYFHCQENKLTNIDVSNNTALASFFCYKNELKSINVAQNKALTTLWCHVNKLTSLDVSKNTALTKLSSYGNNFMTMNVKNGNNKNLNIYTQGFTNNPNLTCIQVDDVAYSNANWADRKDATANYSSDCVTSFVTIPDQNFEQKLIDLGIDTDGLNGKITATNISGITVLDLSNSNISDLSGIENFTSLTYLDVSNNQLTSLNVSNNGLLETLNASSNQLTTLDLSENTKLTIVYVANNPLVSLNLRNGNNRNFIVPTQTGKNAASGLYTSFLGLTALSCIQVDDAAYSNANWSNIKESTTTYANTCKTLGVDDPAFTKATIYPNPTNGEVNITNIALDKATVYNSLGQLVKTFTLDSNNTNNTINLSELTKGIYYIYLINGDAASAKKIIVE